MAKSGYNNLSVMMNKEEGITTKGLADKELYLSKSSLRKLLHHHREGTVEEEELWLRFETDALLQYYALLQVSLIAGFIPPGLDDRTRAEARRVLGNEWVKKYYEENYPYFLPQLMRLFAEKAIAYEAAQPELSRKLFNEFLLANRTIEQDEDVDVFLKMLDYVSYGDIGLNDLVALLKDADALSKSLFKEDKTVLDQSLWGFIKYTHFLGLLRAVLQKAEAVPLLQSAMWEYHSYWFRIMADTMKQFFDTAFANLTKAIADTPEPELMQQSDADDFSYAAVQEQMQQLVRTAGADVAYMLNEKMGDAVRGFYEKLKG
jgi:hypothetical protein